MYRHIYVCLSIYFNYGGAASSIFFFPIGVYRPETAGDHWI